MFVPARRNAKRRLTAFILTSAWIASDWPPSHALTGKMLLQESRDDQANCVRAG
jgi:hypothetical protein